MADIKLINGDCIAKLKEMSDNSVDAVVTDPPYELGFMGKSWDNTGIAYKVELWKEVLRVLKPGGHLLSFGGSRTYHRMACAIEDAGFEIRDQIMWVYGSGFPKSLNVHKKDEQCPDGWGTALKPAHEPICMARKPISENTIAENVLKWGTGGINIDGCRIEAGEDHVKNCDRHGDDTKYTGNGTTFGLMKRIDVEASPKGRFPANFIHDGSEEVVGLRIRLQKVISIPRSRWLGIPYMRVGSRISNRKIGL